MTTQITNKQLNVVSDLNINNNKVKNAKIDTNDNTITVNGDDLALELASKAESSSLSTVATSGNYNDLSNKPTIGNGTITLTQNGTAKGSFTTNQSGDTSITLDGGNVDDVKVNGGSVVTNKVANITVNNSTITIQKNNVDVDNFTLNQNTSKSINIEVPVVVNNVVSTDTDKSLSANMGKELNDRIDSVASRGRYLSAWVASTGLPATNPPGLSTGDTYTYRSGDYYIVGTVSSGTHYKPSGSSYVVGTASTTVETDTINANDVYFYDGTNWILQINTQKEITFANIAGQPSDNSNLASSLNAKENVANKTNDNTSASTTTYPSSYALNKAISTVRPSEITNSGSSLPAVTGYVLNDTFLNTTDKKLYTVINDNYVLQNYRTSSALTLPDFDSTNAIVSGFMPHLYSGSGAIIQIGKYLLSSSVGPIKLWYNTLTIRFHFQLSELKNDGKYYGIYSFNNSIRMDDYSWSLHLKDGELFWRGGLGAVAGVVKLTNYKFDSVTKHYYVEINKIDSTYANTKISNIGYDQELVADDTVECPNYTSTWYSTQSVNIGFISNYEGVAAGVVSPIKLYLLDSYGSDYFVRVSGTNVWDQGYSLTNLAQYADKTNGILYFYCNNQLFSNVSSWGSIQGTLSNQTDLQSALNTKENTSNKSDSYVESSSTTYASTKAVVDGLATKQNVVDSSNKLSSDLVDDTNKTNKFVTSAEKTTWNNKSDFSGSYNDLTNKPTIPTKISDLTDDTATNPIDKADTLTGLTATVAELNYTDGVTSNIQTQLNGKQATIDSSNKLPASNVSGLATVATSGSYNDLNDKPTIPTVNDGTITITQGGVTKGTFTVNQSGNTTVALDSGGSSYTAGDNITINNNVISAVDTKPNLYDIKTLAQSIADRGWACLSKTTPSTFDTTTTVYQDIKNKYDNIPRTTSALTIISNTDKRLIRGYNGKYYYWTWSYDDYHDKLYECENIDLSNPIVKYTLSNSGVDGFVMGSNISIIARYNEYIILNNSTWSIITTITNIGGDDNNQFKDYKIINGVIYISTRGGRFIKFDDSITSQNYTIIYSDFPVCRISYFEDTDVVWLYGGDMTYNNRIRITSTIDFTTYTDKSIYNWDWNTRPITNIEKLNGHYYAIGDYDGKSLEFIEGASQFTATQVGTATLGSHGQYTIRVGTVYYCYTESACYTTTDFISFTLFADYSSIAAEVISAIINQNDFLVKTYSGYCYSGLVKQTSTDTYVINGSTVTQQYYLGSNQTKIISGQTDNTATIYSALGYSPYFTLTVGTNVTLPRNSNLWTMMYVGDNYQEEYLPNGNYSAFATKTEIANKQDKITDWIYPKNATELADIFSNRNYASLDFSLFNVHTITSAGFTVNGGNDSKSFTIRNLDLSNYNNYDYVPFTAPLFNFTDTNLTLIDCNFIFQGKDCNNPATPTPFIKVAHTSGANNVGAEFINTKMTFRGNYNLSSLVVVEFNDIVGFSMIDSEVNTNGNHNGTLINNGTCIKINNTTNDINIILNKSILTVSGYNTKRALDLSGCTQNTDTNMYYSQVDTTGNQTATAYQNIACLLNNGAHIYANYSDLSQSTIANSTETFTSWQVNTSYNANDLLVWTNSGDTIYVKVVNAFTSGSTMDDIWNQFDNGNIEDYYQARVDGTSFTLYDPLYRINREGYGHEYNASYNASDIIETPNIRVRGTNWWINYNNDNLGVNNVKSALDVLSNRTETTITYIHNHTEFTNFINNNNWGNLDFSHFDYTTFSSTGYTLNQKDYTIRNLYIYSNNITFAFFGANPIFNITNSRVKFEDCNFDVNDFNCQSPANPSALINISNTNGNNDYYETKFSNTNIHVEQLTNISNVVAINVSDGKISIDKSTNININGNSSIANGIAINHSISSSVTGDSGKVGIYIDNSNVNINDFTTLIRAINCTQGSGATVKPKININYSQVGANGNIQQEYNRLSVLVPNGTEDFNVNYSALYPISIITSTETFTNWAINTTYNQNDLLVWTNPDDQNNKKYVVVQEQFTTGGSLYDFWQVYGDKVQDYYTSRINGTCYSAYDPIDRIQFNLGGDLRPWNIHTNDINVNSENWNLPINDENIQSGDVKNAIKELAARGGITGPDYTAGISIPNSGTILNDGWIKSTCYDNGSMDSSLYVNNVIVASAPRLGSMNDYAEYTIIVPVKAGDTYSGNQVVFYPNR